MARYIVLRATVEYELTDETELRTSGVAGEGDRGADSGDVAASLLLASFRERLTLPGTRVIGGAVIRDPDAER